MDWLVEKVHLGVEPTSQCFYSHSLRTQKCCHLLIHISLALQYCWITAMDINLANLWNVTTGLFLKMKMWIYSRLRINPVIIPWGEFPRFLTNSTVTFDHMFFCNFPPWFFYRCVISDKTDFNRNKSRKWKRQESARWFCWCFTTAPIWRLSIFFTLIDNLALV